MFKIKSASTIILQLVHDFDETIGERSLLNFEMGREQVKSSLNSWNRVGKTTLVKGQRTFVCLEEFIGLRRTIVT